MDAMSPQDAYEMYGHSVKELVFFSFPGWERWRFRSADTVFRDSFDAVDHQLVDESRLKRRLDETARDYDNSLYHQSPGNCVVKVRDLWINGESVTRRYRWMGLSNLGWVNES